MPWMEDALLEVDDIRLDQWLRNGSPEGIRSIEGSPAHAIDGDVSAFVDSGRIPFVDNSDRFVADDEDLHEGGRTLNLNIENLTANYDLVTDERVWPYHEISSVDLCVLSADFLGGWSGRIDVCAARVAAQRPQTRFLVLGWLFLCLKPRGIGRFGVLSIVRTESLFDERLIQKPQVSLSRIPEPHQISVTGRVVFHVDATSSEGQDCFRRLGSKAFIRGRRH